MEHLHNTVISFTSTQCDDENFLEEDIMTLLFVPDAQHGVWPEAGHWL